MNIIEQAKDFVNRLLHPDDPRRCPHCHKKIGTYVPRVSRIIVLRQREIGVLVHDVRMMLASDLYIGNDQSS